MKCPHCEADMQPMDHGICPSCKRYCGCSFNPTTANDYCAGHRPNRGAGTRKMKKAKKVRCKHCGKTIVQDTAGRGWRHGETGPYLCSDTYATPRSARRKK